MASRTRLLLGTAPVLVALLVATLQAAGADEARVAGPPVGGAAAPAAADVCAGEHWVGAWRAAPQGSSLGRPDDAPFGDADGLARIFADQTLRMAVRPALDGSALRVRLGNRFGVAPVTITSATVARRSQGAAAVPGSVDALTFGGEADVVLAPGREAITDPVFLDVRAGEDLLVSFHVVGTAVLDHHQWAVSTQYAAPTGAGDHTFDALPGAFTEELTAWYGIAGVDVLAPRSTGIAVAVGDSITDGIGSSPDLARRWPDRLNERLRAAGVRLSVLNAGIAGNHVVTNGLTSPIAIGPSAVERLGPDALAVDGVTDIVLFAGINDIFMSGGDDDVVARLVDGYRTIIDEGRRAGLRVIGATVTPASMDAAREAARLAVNDWIRTSGAFDAVVDLDAVARDPADPSRLRPAWDAGMAHLTDPGYEALAAAFDLTVFAGTGC